MIHCAEKKLISRCQRYRARACVMYNSCKYITAGRIIIIIGDESSAPKHTVLIR